MKNHRTTLVLALSASLPLTWSTAARADVVFFDNLDSNSTAPYTFSGQNLGTWAAASGKLQTSLTQTAHNPTSPGTAAINGVLTSTHFKIEADIQAIGQTPGSPADFGHVGVFWGYQDSNNFSISYLRLHADQVTAFQYPFTSELLTSVGATSPAADPSGPSYHLAVEVNYATQTMTVTLDGISATYGPANFGSANSLAGIGGTLGLISWGERVSYDNVMVTDFTVSNVPESGTLPLLAAGVALLVAVRRWRRA